MIEIRSYMAYMYLNMYINAKCKVTSVHSQALDLCSAIHVHYLNFQEFTNADDTCYLAHCYPYTYTDLRDDLDRLLAQGERAKVMKREVMCETRAGNSCFLITVTNFGKIVYSRQCLCTYKKTSFTQAYDVI